MDKVTVCSPYDGTILEQLPLMTHPEVEVALRTAERTFADRKHWIPLWERLDILQRTAQSLEEQAEDFVRTAVLEGGKPWRDSHIELQRAIEGIRTAIAEMRSIGGREIPMDLTSATADRHAFTIREPAGVVLAISAFNHPINMIIHQVIPCVAAGCPVLIKPALETPLSCRRLVEILYEAGLPTAWCQMILCTNEVTAQLAQDPRLDFVSFVGAPEVGWSLRSHLAPGVRCTLEHGGAAPVIVLKDANLPAMLPRLAKGGFYHAGQVCVSVQRVFVPEMLSEQVIEGLAEQARKQRVGNPLDETTDVGPLIRPTSVDTIHEWVQEANATVTGGQRMANQCYAPTILADPPPIARVSTEEIFGPVICVYRYDTLEEAIQRANAVPFAFQAALFGQCTPTLVEAAHHLNATAVMLNDHTAFRADWMPFGGRKRSGLGIGGIPYTIADLLPEKLLVNRQLP